MLERDELTVWGGLRNGRTTGGPVGVSIGNAEWESWDEAMNPWAVCVEAACMRAVTAPRPGHADLAGSVKFGHRDMRNVLERSSARTTAPRTVAGTLAARMLEELGVAVRGAVESIGGVAVRTPETFEEWTRASLSELGVSIDVDSLVERAMELGRDEKAADRLHVRCELVALYASRTSSGTRPRAGTSNHSRMPTA